MAHPGGRPTEYSEEKLDLARAYLDGGWELEGDVVPQIAGLALAMGVHRDTLYEWASHDDKPEFSDIFMRVKHMQERRLVSGGLSGDFNPAITKMLLTKHGYSDKQEIEQSGPNGGPIRTEGKWTVEFLNPSDD